MFKIYLKFASVPTYACDKIYVRTIKVHPVTDCLNTFLTNDGE